MFFSLAYVPEPDVEDIFYDVIMEFCEEHMTEWDAEFNLRQGWKLLSYSQCQEFGQRSNLAPDWLPENIEPIRSQVSSLTQCLTLTTTQKFLHQEIEEFCVYLELTYIAKKTRYYSQFYIAI